MGSPLLSTINYQLLTDWINIFSSSEAFKCNVVKAMLDEYGITYTELNRKDSTYTMIGEIEIYVKPGDEIFSRLLIKQKNLE